MSEGKADDLKGRAKEAVGDLTDNEDLQSEGQVDQATGSLKDKVSDVIDRVRGWVSGKR